MASGGSVVVSQAPALGEQPVAAGVQKVALPLHVQMLQRALNVDQLISQVQAVLDDSQDSVRLTLQSFKASSSSIVPTNGRRLNVPKNQLYNFENVSAERKWVQDLLLSDSDGSGSELSDSEQLQIMLELQYKRRKKWRKRLRRDPKLLRYKYFSVGLLLKDDPYPEHVKAIEEKYHTHIDPSREEGVNKIETRQKLWSFIAKKEIPKMAKQFHTARHNIITNNRKIAQLCQREVKKLAAKSQKVSKEASVQPRARRLMKEAMIYWRKYEKVEREQRRKAEKEAMEQRKLDDDMREAKKQQRKLNFLITQTELYAHFMAKKLTGEVDLSDMILQKLNDAPLQREIRPGVVVNLEQPEDYDTDAIKARVLSNVQSAFKKHEQSNLPYKELARHGVGQSVADEAKTDLQESFDKTFSLATPVLISDKELPQPTIFKGKLKVYQLKGMSWLANLYDQGINGILADEMGLGKTVQSIAFLAHLAEHQRTWGPFLIVSPASTLHNWQQECTRFVPRFKVLPYWGSPHERKIIRKYWNQKLLYRENAPFHILITSYQLVVQDVKYFQRVKWQYMILDEAQAIKSSSSVRWKVLLSFNCRNRLLLTGTPIQNTMQELWALLHFIMPTMFDSHEEFNEWFSKDIESHAEKKSVLDEHQLSRLHLILKPFMLRRIKKDVEHEMAEKIEVHLSCDLSTRQRRLYDGLRKRISIEDLFQSSAAQAANSSRDTATSHLLNLVMQFRKVCNHPDLFERRNVTSPISVSISSVSIPTLVYHQILTPSLFIHRLHTVTLGVHSTAHIHTSSQEERGCWSFLRFIDTTPQEANTVLLGSLAERLLVVMNLVESVHVVYQQRFWGTNLSNSRASRSQLLLWPSFTLSHTAQKYSPTLRNLVFTSHTSTAYTHTTHHIYPLGTSSTELSKISSTVSDPATEERTEMETRDCSESSSPGFKDGFNKLDNGSSSSIACSSNHPTNAESLSPNNAHHTQSLIDQDSQQSTDPVTGVRQTSPKAPPLIHNRKHAQYHCMLTDMPKFVVAYSPKVRVPWNPLYCSHRSAENARQLCLAGGPPSVRDIMLHGCHKREVQMLDILRNRELAGLDALKPPNGWSHIQIPDKENMIYDSGKMVVLDKLLAQLKRESHRVLIYSQMTRMIDLLEEFMSCRRYKYIRLDGSSKISDRRDMVADFQTNSEIFAFLLSTRAGGLGINLTAADTVIFYDSDWNPTVDQQAMDRAHRLGQTKQVTVYRLIVKGSIEERILQRAREKSEIQKMVISGGDFKPDALKAKEMVSLLLDDDEMETRFLAKQAEKKAILDQQGKKPKNNRKRKNVPNGREGESLLKRPATGTGLVSSTPSPLMFSTRPDSVISVGSNSEIFNGDDSIDVVGSIDGTEVNSEVARQGGGGTTPVRKLTGTRRTDGGGLGAKKTSAPLGGRGKMQRSSKKGGSGSAAASAGAMAGALAASSAAYAAYAAGYGLSPHQISPSPSNSGGSPGGATLISHHGNSVHSSPRVSPVPQAFVATSLITTPPTSKGAKNIPANNITTKNNV